MTRPLYAVALMGIMLPAGVFGADDVYVSISDLSANYKTCGAVIPMLPPVLGPTSTGAQWFQAKDFTLGAENTISLGSAAPGAGAGKASFMPTVFTKTVDECTPGLLSGVTTEFPSNGGGTTGAILVLRSSGIAAGRAPVLLIRFQLAFIASDKIEESAGDDTASETVTLQVGLISYSYFPQGPDGALLQPICYGWDFTRNIQWTAGCSAT